MKRSCIQLKVGWCIESIDYLTLKSFQMQHKFLNIWSVLTLLLTLLIYSFSYFIVFDHALDAYQRGYRYIVLKMELVIFPLFFLISIGHIIYSVIKNKAVSRKTTFLSLRYFLILLGLLILFFFLGMFFNDASAPGANIKYQ